MNWLICVSVYKYWCKNLKNVREADEGRGSNSRLLYVMLYQLKLWAASVLDLILFCILWNLTQGNLCVLKTQLSFLVSPKYFYVITEHRVSRLECFC